MHPQGRVCYRLVGCEWWVWGSPMESVPRLYSAASNSVGLLTLAVGGVQK